MKTNKKHIQPLAVTQNKLLRILQFKARKIPLKSLYKAFDVLKLKDLHYLNICCIVHKNSFTHPPCLLPEAINDIFRKNKQAHQYNTRQKNDLHPVKINSKLYGDKTISFQGRDYWNNLPNNLKEVTSLSLFKKIETAHIRELLKLVPHPCDIPKSELKLIFFPNNSLRCCLPSFLTFLLQIYVQCQYPVVLSIVPPFFRLQPRLATRLPVIGFDCISSPVFKY